MKLRTLLFVTCLILAGKGFAQCDTAKYTYTGFFPSYIPTAGEGTNYSKTVVFVLPIDTTVSGFAAHIDSLTISGITGFPANGNFTYSCDNGNCLYKATNYTKYFKGCITLSGTPPIGSAGRYKLSISVKAYARVFGNPVSQSYTDTTFKLRVEACALTASINEGPQMSMCPNASGRMIHGSPSGAYYTYNWLLNSSSVGSADSLMVTAPGTYTVTITDTMGCSSTAQIVVDQPTDPKPQISQTVACPNLPNDIASNLPDCAPYQSWTSTTGGSFTSGIGTTTKYLFSASEIANATANIKLDYMYGSDCSCPGSITKSLTVMPLPTKPVIAGTDSFYVSNGENGVTYTWTNKGAALATGVSTGKLGSGIYSLVVTATKGGCSISSDTLVKGIWPAGIEPIQSWELQLFPNPLQQGQNLSFQWNGPSAMMRIYSINGQEVYHELVTTGRQVIQLTDLAPGTYVVSISSNGKETRQRLVIQGK